MSETPSTPPAPAAKPALASAATRRPSPMRQLLGRPWFGPTVALVLVYALFALLRPDTFVGSINLLTMLRQTVVVAICAVGMTYVIILGGIDLSVGSAVALTTVVVAQLLRHDLGPWPAAAAGVGAAALLGAVNGAIVAWLKITPFIVTLGTMSVLRGLAKGAANEQKIDAPARGLDELMLGLAPDQAWMLFSPGVWIAIAVAVLFGVGLRFTVFGRHVIAIGSNALTARLCGVNVPGVTLAVYALMGLLGGLAGVLEFSNLTVGDPTDSIGLELEVIAAVVIGGGSLSGGQGSIIGAMVGALLMTTIKTGCTHTGVPNWVQEILTGAIIVIAVGVDRWRKP